MAERPVLSGWPRRVAVAAGLLLSVATGLGLHLTPSPRSPGAMSEGPQPLPLARLVEPAHQDPVSGWHISTLRTHQGVLVLEFPSLAEQGAALNRGAALIEKAGAPRDRVLDDPSLDAFIAQSGSNAATFLYGHDYAADQLARLFNLAHRQQLRLNPSELRLLALLQGRGLLYRDATGQWQGDRRRALVTISRVQPDDPATPDDDSLDEDLRGATLRHELSHGAYFVDPVYRAACHAFWRQLSEDNRGRLRRHFASLGYDQHDEDLMVNETQAFLLHTPAPYGLQGANLGLDDATLDAWRKTLQERAGRTLPLHRFP